MGREREGERECERERESEREGKERRALRDSATKACHMRSKCVCLRPLQWGLATDESFTLDSIPVFIFLYACLCLCLRACPIFWMLLRSDCLWCVSVCLCAHTCVCSVVFVNLCV